jgi:predicted lipoprotein with Yx(FWY)xxD motif
VARLSQIHLKEKNMNTQHRYWSRISAFLLMGLIVLAACAPASTPIPDTAIPPTVMPTNPPAPTDVPTVAPTTAPTVAPTTAPAVVPNTGVSIAALALTKNDTLGAFLADGAGRSLYLFTKDTKDTSNCYDKCAAAWPPLLTSDKPTVGDGLDAALVGTTQRKDGTTQVTYNGWPLYYYTPDQKPGDVTGQAVGKVWWVISGEGWAIKPAALQLTANDQFGKFLTDGDGRSLYLFTKDTKDTSNCYGKCEAAWPPLLQTVVTATVGDGLNASLVGTTVRKDGSMQVTYRGWPLYYYTPDQKPGDVTGQAVGKVWWVVSGEGWAIKPAGLQLATDAKLGKFLADADGRTLYIFTKDTKDTSVCYDKCEAAWPPLLQDGKPTLGDGLDATLLGTTQRKDGSMQVTYAGMPLYYYTPDQKPGDTTGQGVGKVWYVIGADGKIIQ